MYPSDKAAPQLYHFDHVYPASGEAGTAVIVYARLGSASFGDFHSAVKSLAAAGTVRYILRHYVQKSRLAGRDRLRMSGYGVELAVKSTEYKAVDDSAVNEGGQSLPRVLSYFFTCGL